MLISVIIPVFNEEKVIGECIESLQKQAFKDFEIIIVDDGSTDGTKAVLEKFGLKVFEQKHQGPAVARNLGAKNAKGMILVFVDGDMTFSQDFLKNLTTPIDKGDTFGTFSKEEYVSNWDNVWAKCWNINENLPIKRRLPTNYPNNQKVFRAILKKEFDRVGGFSKGGYTDDYTLSEKLGYEAVNAKDAVFYHKNPSGLIDVFGQAKWVGKRAYKLGLVGILIALIRASLPISILIGVFKAIKFSNYNFILFKTVYDFGIFIGVLEMFITGKLSK